MHQQYTPHRVAGDGVRQQLIELLERILEGQSELQRVVDRIAADVDALDRFNRPFGDGTRVRYR